MPAPFTTAVPTSQPSPQGGYGLASRFDFDNPEKWFTVPDVPLLDEHELTGADGEPEGYVDRKVLEEIAANNNRRVYSSGDPATIILGHTSDDPRAAEKPAKGFVVNYKVRPTRDPQTGQTKYQICGDYKFRPWNAHLAEEYPRRSVELWLGKREIDPIAILGGTTPERDLGVIIRKAREKNPQYDFGSTFARTRLANVVLDHKPRTERERLLAKVGEVVHYKARGGVMFRYAMGECPMPMNNGMPPSRYAEGADDEPDGDEPDVQDDPFDAGDDGAGDDDPIVAKVLASKPIKDLMSKVDQIFAAVTGEGGAGGPPMGDGMDAPGGEPPIAGGMDAPGGAPPMGAPPGGPGMGAPPGGNPDEEAAMFHGAGPVRFEEDDGTGTDRPPTKYNASGFAGPGSTFVPATTGAKKKPFNRGGSGMNGTANGRGRAVRPAPVQRVDPGQQERVRMQRQINDLQYKLARADAEKQVAALEAEGVLFGDTPEDTEKAKAEMIEFLSVMDAESQAWEIGRVRKFYRRREETPVHPSTVGVARFARADVGDSGDGDFDPKTPDESMVFAEAIQRMGRTEAIKYMRQRGRTRTTR